jgi:thiamine-phosphate pyrophosphorylase
LKLETRKLKLVPVLLYYITDRSLFAGSEDQRRKLVLGAVQMAAYGGIDFIQLREKDLSSRELERLAGEAVGIVEQARSDGSSTKLLINSRTDIAIAVGADGVHLRSDDINASDARAIFGKAGIAKPIIGVSCHTPEEVALAESHGADFAVFGPVFEKNGMVASNGLEELRRACARPAVSGNRMKVFALGGVTLANASACIEAGTDGIAGIRLFQAEDVAERVAQLREIAKPLSKERPAYPYGKS